MEHLLYYALGLAIGIAVGTALGMTFAKEQRNRAMLPIMAAAGVVAGLLIGYALDTFAAFVHMTASSS
jgi:hypothetical protein